MPTANDLLEAFEMHSPAGILAALEDGISPIAPIGKQTPIQLLIEMYTRSQRFPECLHLMLKAGAKLNDRYLEAILLDDADQLRRMIDERPQILTQKFHLGCAYTSLRGVSGLHVCAEYNSVKCAKTILNAGMNVDVQAEINSEGFGGQTPLFHAVNSNRNYCRPVMKILADAGANIDIRLKGLVWGFGHDWETVVFDVTPISYAQCGLYPQFHRLEEHVYANVAYLYERREQNKPPLRNVPNKYVAVDFNLAAARRGQMPDETNESSSAS